MEKVPVASMALKLTCLLNHCSSAGNEGFICCTHWQKATQSILIVGGKEKCQCEETLKSQPQRRRRPFIHCSSFAYTFLAEKTVVRFLHIKKSKGK